MALSAAVQMDPLEPVNIDSDTTFFMMLSAQALGHKLFVYDTQHLSLDSGKLTARGRDVTVQAVKGDHAHFGPWRVQDLSEVDVVLMRQDPPFDMNYVTAAMMLETIHPKTLVVNDPRSVRDAPEKLFAATHFAHLQPPTLISNDPEALTDFHRRHKDVVLKPLHGAAGSGVVRLKEGDPNLGALLEMHAACSRDQLVMQAFIPGVAEGDKRIILVDGEPVGAINRVPEKGQVRSNLRVGGTAQPVELSARDLEICAAVGPTLRDMGLIFVGLDVIAGHLTEINVTSPTGAQQLFRFTGINAADVMWQAVDRRLASR